MFMVTSLFMHVWFSGVQAHNREDFTLFSSDIPSQDI